MIKLGIYEHSKSGRLYYIYDIQRDSEDANVFRASYRGLYNHNFYGPGQRWNRPLKMFSDMVVLDDGKEELRFKYLRRFTVVDYIKYFIFKKW